MRVQVSEAYFERDDEPITARGVSKRQHLHPQYPRYAVIAFPQELT